MKAGARTGGIITIHTIEHKISLWGAGTQAQPGSFIPRTPHTCAFDLVAALYEEMFPALSNAAAWASEQMQQRRQQQQQQLGSSDSHRSNLERDVRRAPKW